MGVGEVRRQWRQEKLRLYKKQGSPREGGYGDSTERRNEEYGDNMRGDADDIQIKGSARGVRGDYGASKERVQQAIQ